jgi:hypothetical protein
MITAKWDLFPYGWFFYFSIAMEDVNVVWPSKVRLLDIGTYSTVNVSENVLCAE